ncbi:hypothetical protein BpHYR1_048777 [Brachionus plicatilis]|uniref:Uncharacterized protein n=1 Tax=Brachionus plicatilis TaxID=10195 RepID=A0A3M7SFN9_BRAPC|nr:hypothetical protein BpHYR1_048777 [Brachionus plicatilis]
MSFIALQRQSTIKCICSNIESFSGGETYENNYLFLKEFTFNSPCCCPDECSGKKPGKSGGLSFGSVLLIMTRNDSKPSILDFNARKYKKLTKITNKGWIFVYNFKS